MLFVNPLFIVLLLLFVVQAFCGEGYGKEPRPKLPPMPIPKKEEKHEKKEAKQTFSVCFQGYTLRHDKKCIREIIEPPIINSNVVNVPYLQRCPPGYEERKKGACSILKEVVPEFYCPVGWTDNVNDCIVIEPPEFAFECPKGKKWELVEDKCVFIKKAKPIVTTRCPEDSHVEEDGHCWKSFTTFDCTPERKGKKKDDKKDQGHKKEMLRLLGEKDEGKKDDKKPRIELLKEMEQVTPPRTTKVGVATQLCEKKVLVEPIIMIACPDGFIEMGGEECWKQEVTSPIRVCASNDKKDGKKEGDCRGKARSTPKVAKCPDGSERQGDRCVQTTTLPPLNVCPIGWTDDGNGCVGALDEPPEAECQPGLKLVGDKCVGELVRPAISLTLKVEDCESKPY